MGRIELPPLRPQRRVLPLYYIDTVHFEVDQLGSTLRLRRSTLDQEKYINSIIIITAFVVVQFEQRATGFSFCPFEKSAPIESRAKRSVRLDNNN